MRTLSRIGVVSLIAIGAFLVAGAAAGDAYAASPAEAGVKISAKVRIGQRIDVGITCRPSDDRARLHITGRHLDRHVGIDLDEGRASLSYRVPLVPPGKYDIDLTCTPSKATASAATRVTI